MKTMLDGILRRPRSVMTLMLVTIVLGVTAYISIPKEASPDIDIPVFYVSVSYQGISPADGERLLARPMETALRGLDGLKELTAIASEGHLGVVLEFDINFDKDKALADVRDKVDEAKAKLPADVDDPQIIETNFALQPTLMVTLSGEVPMRTLQRHARLLKDKVESIGSVLSADLSGYRKEVLEVVIDSVKLESYSLTQEQLLNALAQNNRLVPAGFLDDGNGRFNIKVPGLIETAEDVYALPILQNDEGLVMLGDVAEIRRTFKDASTFTRVNGRPAIAMQVVKRKGMNIIENNQAVRDKVQEVTADWPEAIKINFLLDESDLIGSLLGSLQSSILTAIFLVMILVIASLGLKSALLVGFAIPTSFMIGFLTLTGIGMTVNTMVMFGLVLTVGILVDGAIVMVEYADRKISEGMADQEAYIRASKLMFWPIVSSTATTLVAFLPMLLWPGVPGEFMSYLPIMVIIVLSASLITALIFLPVTGAMLSRIFRIAGQRAELLGAVTIGGIVGLIAFSLPALTSLAAPLIYALAAMAFAAGSMAGYFALKPLIAYSRRQAAARHETGLLTAKMLSAEMPLDIKKLRGPIGFYIQLLKLCISSPLGNIVTLVTVVAIGASITFFFMQHATGVEFFVDEEPDRAIVFVSARGNLSAIEARDLAAQVEQVVLSVSGVKNVVFSASASGGSSGPQIGDVSDKPGDVISEISLELVNYCCRRKAVEIFAEIQQKTAGLAGIKVETRKIEGGPPSGKSVQLEVKSTSYDDMVATVSRARAFIDQIPDLKDIEDDRPLPAIEWQLAIDREQAGHYQAPISSIGALVQLVTNGVKIGNYRPDDSEDEVEIRVRLPQDERSLNGLDQLNLQTPRGLMPISNFVTREARQKVSSIVRRDGLYAMDIKANISADSTATPNDKKAEIDNWIKTQIWPSSVQFHFRGADEDQQESGAFLIRAMIASLFLMFIILVTQFNSFYQSILTLSTILMSVFGVLLGMALTGQKFSIIMSGTGVVALAGIVVNNAIVLIDTYNRMRGDGIEPVEAVLKTAAQRIRPVLLTTITTIAGLIPMATQVNLNFFERVITVGSVNSIWWVQLSTAIISGLAFSTIITLLVVPTMLALPTVWGDARRRWFKFGIKGSQGNGQQKDRDNAKPEIDQPLSAPAGRPAQAAE